MSKQLNFSSISNKSIKDKDSLNSKTVLFQTIHLRISTQFRCNFFFFQAIQFNINTQFKSKNISISNSSIWSIDRTQSSTTTPGQSGIWSDGNAGVPHIVQSSSITGNSPADCRN